MMPQYENVWGGGWTAKRSYKDTFTSENTFR